MRRRGVHVSRTSLALLAVLAIWVCVFTLAAAWLDRPGVRHWLAGELAARLEQAAGQRVAVGDVRVELMPLRFVLAEVEVGPAEAPALAVARVEVAPGGVRLNDREVVLDHVRVRGVRVNSRLPESSGERAGSWFRVLVKQVEVEDVQVTNLELPAGLAVAVDGLDALVTGSRRTPLAAAVVRGSRVRLQVPGLDPVIFSLQAWGKSTPGGYEVRRVLLAGGGLHVDGSGSVGSRSLRAGGVARVDLAWLDRTVGAHADLLGDVNLRWSLLLPPDGPFMIETQVRGDQVGVAGFALAELDGELTLTPEGLEGSLRRARVAGGEVEGVYQLGLGPPWPHQVAVRGRGLTVAGFLGLLGVDGAGLAGSFDANAELGWQGGHIKGGRGLAVASFRPLPGDVPVAGRVQVGLEADGALHIEAASTTLADAPVRWAGTITLGDWIPDWTVQAKDMPVSTVARLLRGWVGTDVLPEQLAGRAALDVRLLGAFGDLTVTGQVAVAPVTFGPVEVDGLETSLRVGQGVARFEDGVLYAGPGRMTCSGELAYGRGSSLDFTLGGRGVPLDRVVSWSGIHAPVTGRVAFSGRLDGSLDQPRVESRLDLSSVVVAGVPFGSGTGRIGVASGVVDVGSLAVGPFSASARIDLRRRVAEVAAAIQGFGMEGLSPPLARLAGGALDLRLQGSFPFDAPAGRLEVESAEGGKGYVEMDAQGVRGTLARPGGWRLGGALRRAGREYAGHLDYAVESWRSFSRDLAGTEVPVDGQLVGEAEIRLAPPRPAQLDGTIRALTVTVEGEQVHLREPGRFRVDGGEITLLDTTLVGDRASLFLRGARGADGHLSGRIEGELPAVLLRLLWPEGHASGRAKVQAEISGTDEAPRFAGTASIRDGTLQLDGLPGAISHIEGEADLIPEAVRLSGMRFAFLGGTGVCDGQVILAPRVELDLALRGDRLRWPLGVGLTPVLAGTARLVGPLDNLSLTADATLQRTVYTRPLDLQKLVVEGVLAPVRVRAANASPITFNLGVKVPGSFEVATEMARLVARGELRVVGSSALPGLLGRLEAIPGAELEVTGVRYELLHGRVSFADPESIEPYLDILARTTVQGFEITVGLVGTLDRMTPTFSANPPLPEMDIIALLSVGRKADETGSLQAGTVASSFLTDQLTGAVTRRARTLLDVDQLRVDPFAATQTGDPTARLTVVKQLSRDWTVTVATNLTANREEVIASRFRLGSGLFLDAVRQADGSYFMELKWQRRY